MENICEWDNCNENGEFKAPIERDNSKIYRWLCQEHIKLFNKNWNYFYIPHKEKNHQNNEKSTQH